MATRKAAEQPTSVAPDPDVQQDGGGGDVAVVIPDEQADAPAAPAPAPATTPAPHPTGGFHRNTLFNGTDFFPPSSITVAKGTSGFYSGARDAEPLVEYDFRMGSTADTFGDLGWLLGTKPRA